MSTDESPTVGTDAQADRVRRRDDTLQRWGIRAWLFVGIAAAATFVAGLFGAISGLIVPLVIAAVVGMLFVPAVDRLSASCPAPSPLRWCCWRSW